MKQAPKTLNTTWKYCVQLWTDIKTAIQLGSIEDVMNMKKKWLDIHGFGSISHFCFFCHWVKERSIVQDPNSPGGCPDCPGTKIDPDFCCQGDIDWQDDPIEFADYIIKLNQERLRRKKR